jgi:hypothetical protein
MNQLKPARQDGHSIECLPTLFPHLLQMCLRPSAPIAMAPNPANRQAARTKENCFPEAAHEISRNTIHSQPSARMAVNGHPPLTDTRIPRLDDVASLNGHSVFTSDSLPQFKPKGKAT